jgi:hypothetical protein
MEEAGQTDGQAPDISPAVIDIDQLERWHNEYMAVDADGLDPMSSIILAVNSDYIDVRFIESQIEQAMSTTNVSRGYCNDCQHLFNHWPDLGTESWTHAVGRPCRTVELEAATRNGCKSCAFLLSQLQAAELLDTFHRIEKRLSLFNDTATSSISISNWGTDSCQLLWLNFPGKVATSCNSSCAMRTRFESSVVSPLGKRNTDSICINLIRPSKLL